MKRRQTPTVTVPAAVRHYLLTGEDTSHLDGKWALFQLRYGPLGSTREVMDSWDAAAAFAPYRAALIAEGLTPVRIPEIDDDNNDNHLGDSDD